MRQHHQLQHHHLDVIIYATGFSLADNWASLTGKNGTIESFYGCFYENTPNFFCFYGPHANLGHFSIIYMIECQMNMLVNVLKSYFEVGANVCLGKLAETTDKKSMPRLKPDIKHELFVEFL